MTALLVVAGLLGWTLMAGLSARAANYLWTGGSHGGRLVGNGTWDVFPTPVAWLLWPVAVGVVAAMPLLKAMSWLMVGGTGKPREERLVDELRAEVRGLRQENIDLHRRLEDAGQRPPRLGAHR